MKLYVNDAGYFAKEVLTLIHIRRILSHIEEFKDDGDWFTAGNLVTALNDLEWRVNRARKFAGETRDLHYEMEKRPWVKLPGV